MKLLQITLFWWWLCVLVSSSMVNPSKEPRGGGRDDQAEKKRKIAKGKKVVGSSKKKSLSDDEYEEEDEQEDGWKTSIQNRGVKCERQVDFRRDPVPRAVQMINDRGMAFWTLQVHGYILWMVREFYANMSYNNHHQVIESTVRGHKIVVTPDSIAEYFRYERPETSLLPFRPLSTEVVDPRLVRDTILAKSGGWKGTHFVLGSLHLEYQMANKILHYNLLPKGTEKMPNKRAAELIYAFMQPEIVIDFALWIWMEMRDFMIDTSFRASMPYPAMITRMVRDKLGGKYLREALTPGNPGAITEASWRKAATHSLPRASSSARPSSSNFGATYEPKEKSGFKRIEEFLRTILCRQDDIVKSQKKLQRRVEFCMGAAATQLGDPYETPPDSDADHEEEEEEEEFPDLVPRGTGGSGGAFGPGADD